MIADTLLLRQVSPSWIQAGRVTSQVFKPTPKDGKRISVYNADLMTAEESWCHYTTELQFSSVGVLAVSVGECDLLKLPAEPDPEPFPAHAVIRFDHGSKSQIENVAKRLKRFADLRGWQYQPDATV